jgi:hypothetical protein
MLVSYVKNIYIYVHCPLISFQYLRVKRGCLSLNNWWAIGIGKHMDFVVGMRCGLATPKNLENRLFRESFYSDDRSCSNMEGIHVHPLGFFTQSVILKVAGIKELCEANTEEQWVIKFVPVPIVRKSPPLN